MRITIHQPEHFPYMGFFQKVAISDTLVLLDTVKFRKNYFQNRNRILDRSGREIWLTVPVMKDSSSKLIKDVKVSSDEKWRKKILRTIKQNLNFDASHFYQYNSLAKINVSGIKWALKEFDIQTKVVLASNLNARGNKSELLAAICNELGATTYVSGPSGRDYLNEEVFTDIKVEYFSPNVNDNLSCLSHICNS
jgi:hypothetical protein